MLPLRLVSCNLAQLCHKYHIALSQAIISHCYVREITQLYSTQYLKRKH